MKKNIIFQNIIRLKRSCLKKKNIVLLICIIIIFLLLTSIGIIYLFLKDRNNERKENCIDFDKKNNICKKCHYGI